MTSMENRIISGAEQYKGTTEPNPASPQYLHNPDGIVNETQGREVDPEMYQKDIDERITRIRPMATPVDQIARYAAVQHASSFEVKYYSVGTRPVKTTLVANVAASETATSVALQVADPDMFTLDDTIRVVGVKGTTNYRGSAYDPDASDTPDLVLCVCGKTSEGQPIVYAVNGRVVGQQNIGVPAIQRGTVLKSLRLPLISSINSPCVSFRTPSTASAMRVRVFSRTITRSTTIKNSWGTISFSFSVRSASE